jgi:hypothetical protein
MNVVSVTVDAKSQTMDLLRWLEWFEKTNGYVPSRVVVHRGLMQALCYENGIALNMSEYGIAGVGLGVIPDA